MFSKNQEQRTQTLTKQIPQLGQIPKEERLIVFNLAFKSMGYRLFLGLILIAFILVFYFKIDAILDWKGLERGGILARSVHFLKELGVSFFTPLMVVMLIMVLGRNYFVKKEVKKYLAKNAAIY